MAAQMVQKVESLWVSMGAHERRHRHYSRALGWLLWGLVVAMLVLGQQMKADRPPADPLCRLATDARDFAVPVLALELAHSPAIVRGLLQGNGSATSRSEPCVEARAQAFREVFMLDNSLFIPVYGLLSATALAWMVALSAHAQPPQTPTGAARFRQALQGGVLIAMLLVLITASLDARENRAALLVLDMASGQGALADAATANWAPQVMAMRSASLWKWLCSGAWAATLAGLAAHMGHVLRHPPGGRWRQTLARGLRVALIALASTAALALLIGSAAGLLADVSAAPLTTATTLGPSAQSPSWLNTLIGIGFAALSACALAMAGLDLTWRWIRPTPPLPAP